MAKQLATPAAPAEGGHESAPAPRAICVKGWRTLSAMRLDLSLERVLA
jgi:hypothetical protein